MEATQQQAHTEQFADSRRHMAPINRELHPDDAKQFVWKGESGEIQSYQHIFTQRHIHIEGSTGQFVDQQKQPISQSAALDRAMGPGNHHAQQQLSQSTDRQINSQGLSL